MAAYAIDQLGKKLLGREDQYELNQQFVGYSMVVTFVPASVIVQFPFRTIGY